MHSPTVCLTCFSFYSAVSQLVALFLIKEETGGACISCQVAKKNLCGDESKLVIVRQQGLGGGFLLSQQ